MLSCLRKKRNIGRVGKVKKGGVEEEYAGEKKTALFEKLFQRQEAQTDRYKRPGCRGGTTKTVWGRFSEEGNIDSIKKKKSADKDQRHSHKETLSPVASQLIPGWGEGMAAIKMFLRRYLFRKSVSSRRSGKKELIVRQGPSRKIILTILIPFTWKV